MIRHGRSSGRERAGSLNPRVAKALKPVLRRIGVPASAPFRPDRFQTEALDLIPENDVLVSAPTGSGKTWIATQAIQGHLEQHLRVWYASPLKALSNSIYRQFSQEFGPPNCGILTGDRKENAQAPVIVGTTEILRNQLYDAMHAGRSLNADLVILDEAHYLADPERGVVWEEVLIYLPPRVRLLLLSATLSNAGELCGWLAENRGVPNQVVSSGQRPVPLEMLFLFPDGLLSPLGGRKGLTPEVRGFLGEAARRGRPRFKNPDFGEIIACLREFKLLPAIFFLKSRADCDRALASCAAVRRSAAGTKRFEETLQAFLEQYPHLGAHRQLPALRTSRVGSHHGGQLPFWKVLIEEMMNHGQLEAIFSTSTVAAGVNFPARTVVLMQSDRFNGREFSDLTATELQQMIGRAGRRGKDHIGFAVVVPGIHQDPALLQALKDSFPEPIRSQIQVNFSMALNLLLSHRPEEIRELLARSLAAYQAQVQGGVPETRWQQVVKQLRRLLEGGRCDTADPYEVLDLIREHAELLGQIRAVEAERRRRQEEDLYRRLLQPGRLFLHRRGQAYMVFQAPAGAPRGEDHLYALSLADRLRLRRGRLKPRRVRLEQVEALYDCRLDMPEPPSPESLAALFGTLDWEKLEILTEPGEEEGEGPGEVAQLTAALNRLPCAGCRHFKACHRPKKSRVRTLLQELGAVAGGAAGAAGDLWLSFKRHLRLLKQTGFVDEADLLTPDGRWASKLRVDQPLLIAEAIRRGALAGASPAVLAGGLAPFVWDRVSDVQLRPEDPAELEPVSLAFERIVERIAGIRELKGRRGFESPPLTFWPAAVLYLWARGMPWEGLLKTASVDEGDLASLIMRTADHLRQVSSLAETHPKLAAAAREAIARILREPVYL